MGKWIDSLFMPEAEYCPQDLRLAQALAALAVANRMRASNVGYPAQRIAYASALIVVERRRLDSWGNLSERYPDPMQPSLLGAVRCLADAMKYDDSSTTIKVIMLRAAEAHLRSLWHQEAQ